MTQYYPSRRTLIWCLEQCYSMQWVSGRVMLWQFFLLALGIMLSPDIWNKGVFEVSWTIWQGLLGWQWWLQPSKSNHSRTIGALSRFLQFIYKLINIDGLCNWTSITAPDQSKNSWLDPVQKRSVGQTRAVETICSHSCRQTLKDSPEIQKWRH